MAAPWIAFLWCGDAARCRSALGPGLSLLDQVRRYTATLRRAGGFPALVGLGGEGKRPTDDILLCDGYHRVAAMRRAGIYYAWAWLAVDLWRTAHSGAPVAAASR